MAHARMAELLKERDVLSDRLAELPPAERADADQRIAAIGREIAAVFAAARPEPVGAVWVPD